MVARVLGEFKNFIFALTVRKKIKIFSSNMSGFNIPRDNNLREQKVIEKEQKELNIFPVHNIDTPYERATLGMGCFWGAESLYGATIGVLRTRVGFSGGTTESPKYRNLGDHTEVIEIDFDPTVISFYDILGLFWNNHEYGLTTKIKKQYMSLILYHSEEQFRIAKKSRTEEQNKRHPEVITTQIFPAGEFYPAEDYHQKYRLQGHTDLVKSLGLNPILMQTSHVATKLNGYLIGVGGLAQFLHEADGLGLSPSLKAYVRYHVEKNEGMGLFC